MGSFARLHVPAEQAPAARRHDRAEVVTQLDQPAVPALQHGERHGDDARIEHGERTGPMPGGSRREV